MPLIVNHKTSVSPGIIAGQPPMMASPRDQSKYNDLIDQLTSNFGQQLKSVLLFGSQTRGETIDPSDRDLFLVISSLTEEPVNYYLHHSNELIIRSLYLIGKRKCF